MKKNIVEYVLKHSRKRDSELKYDFMSSLLEIIERPAHIGGKVIIYSILSLLIVTTIWISFSKIDIIVSASGNVKPVGDINKIQAYANGTIKNINVSDGQYVNKGDLLMELDTSSENIDIDQLNFQIKTLQVQLELYKQIIAGDDITQISTEKYDDSEIPYAMTVIESEKSYKSNINNLQIEKSNKECEYQISIITRDRYADSSLYQTELQTQEIVVQQNKLMVEQAEVNIQNAVAEHDSKVAQSIADIIKQQEDLNSQLEKTNLSQKYQMITSPVDGYINSINVNTVGGVVTTSQELFTVVPKDSQLEMDCYVKNIDIADIAVGDKVEIKLEAYPYSKYGTIPGELTYISPSAFVDEKLGSVYLVKVKIENQNEKVNIIAGLSGSIEIKVGKRSILSYFLDPIVNGMENSLKEK